MTIEKFDVLTTNEKIEKYVDCILPILRESGILQVPAVEKTSALADMGAAKVCSKQR